jgi:hypothetical protein
MYALIFFHRRMHWQISAMSFEPASNRMYVLFPEAAMVRAFQLPDWGLVSEWSTPGGASAVSAGIRWDGMEVSRAPASSAEPLNMVLAMRVSPLALTSDCVQIDHSAVVGMCGHSLRYWFTSVLYCRLSMTTRHHPERSVSVSTQALRERCLPAASS